MDNLLFAGTESYDEIHRRVILIMDPLLETPVELMTECIRFYRNYLKELEADERKKRRSDRIDDIPHRTFCAMYPYLCHVKEIIGEERDFSRLRTEEKELYDNVQMLLWERIENYVKSRIPANAKTKKEYYEDIMQNFRLGFSEKMVLDYDPMRLPYTRPTTFFEEHILRNCIVATKSSEFDISKYNLDKLAKVNRAIALCEMHNITPTEDKIAWIAGVSKKVARDTIQMKEARKYVYLDEPMQDEEGKENDRLPAAKILTPEEEIIRKEMFDNLRDIILEELSKTEAAVLIARVNLYDEIPCRKNYVPFEVVSAYLDLPQSDVKRAYNKAIRKMQNSKRLSVALSHVNPKIDHHDTKTVNEILIGNMKNAIKATEEDEKCDGENGGDEE